MDTLAQVIQCQKSQKPLARAQRCQKYDIYPKVCIVTPYCEDPVGHPVHHLESCTVDYHRIAGGHCNAKTMGGIDKQIARASANPSTLYGTKSKGEQSLAGSVIVEVVLAVDPGSSTSNLKSY